MREKNAIVIGKIARYMKSTNRSGEVHETFDGEGNGDDESADGGHHPRRRVRQRVFILPAHFVPQQTQSNSETLLARSLALRTFLARRKLFVRKEVERN